MGCVDWSVLIQASAIWFIQLLAASSLGLRDLGQLVLNRKSSVRHLGIVIQWCYLKSREKRQNVCMLNRLHTFFYYLKQSMPSETCFIGRPVDPRTYMCSTGAVTLKKGYSIILTKSQILIYLVCQDLLSMSVVNRNICIYHLDLWELNFI